MARRAEGPKIRWHGARAYARFRVNGVRREIALGVETQEDAERTVVGLLQRSPEIAGALLGTVYFVEAVGALQIKIGWSRNIPGRIKRLQAMAVHDLRLLATAPGVPYAIERAVHRRFDDVRIRGEWFFASTSLRAFASRVASGSGVTDLLQ